jgi:hypothetical protein
MQSQQCDELRKLSTAFEETARDFADSFSRTAPMAVPFEDIKAFDVSVKLV